MPKVAVLDDYQGVALEMADWSALAPDCRVQVFRDHLTDRDALADRFGRWVRGATAVGIERGRSETQRDQTTNRRRENALYSIT